MTPATVRVETSEDPRLADYVGLRETSLRRSLEAAHGLFIAEGEKVIRRALEAGYRPRSFLLAERWLPGLADLLTRWPEVPVYLVTEALVAQVTGFHVHRGALASLHREQRYAAADLLRDHRRLVVLEDVVDQANLGAILRSAAGLGWDGVLLSPRAADPLYRRSVKVSMGAVFSLPWARLADWRGVPEQLRSAGFTRVALGPGPDGVDLPDAVRRLADASRTALLLGSEGPGLSAHWAGTADLRVRIPMAAGIDSLNVAAAAAVVCYALGPGAGDG